MRMHRACLRPRDALAAFAFVACTTIAGCAPPALPAPRGVPESEMADAARAFLASLSPELRTRANLAFDAPQRADWHYVPRAFHGVELGSLDGNQREQAMALLRSAMSERGAQEAEDIMALDGILRDIERGRGARRDPLAYAVAVFGTPGTEPWGWRIEGHHLSLSFTGAGGTTAVTPSFRGANPALVRGGARDGMRVLHLEEDLAFGLLASLDAGQRARAVVGAEAPADIQAVPGRSAATVDAVGLPASAMTEAQRAMLEGLLRTYAEDLRPELAARELARIRAAGFERIRFAWMGGERPGLPHYYRVSGPTFVIELDNVQDGANHVHAAWRDRTRDLGEDLLGAHRATMHQSDISSTAPIDSTK